MVKDTVPGCTDKECLCLHFPKLRVSSGSTLPCARFMNPGVPDSADIGAGSLWNPPDLPFGRREARAYLAEMQRFGTYFRRPGDIGYFGAAGVDDFFTGTSLDMSAEMRELEALAGRDVSGDKAKEEEAARCENLRRAQQFLLLAWTYEGHAAELEDIGKNVDSRWDSLGRILGGDDEAESGQSLEEFADNLPGILREGGEAVSADDFPAAPWRPLLEAMAAFIPAGTALYVESEGVVLELEEAGLPLINGLPQELAAACPASGSDEISRLTKGLRSLSTPVYRLLNLSEAPAEKPWLAKMVHMLLPAGKGEEALKPL